MSERRMRTNDPREFPAYTISEAAHYLCVPAATIRYWSVGRGDYAPLIGVPKHVPTLLSFLNLTELHVLAAIRREHMANSSISVRKARQPCATSSVLRFAGSIVTPLAFRSSSIHLPGPPWTKHPRWS